MAMLPSDAVAAGFADPMRSSQSVFRALMTALAEPGSATPLPDCPNADIGMPPAAAALLLTLCDLDTPVYLPRRLAGAAGRFIAFHCGAPITSVPGEARFGFVDPQADDPDLVAFSIGSDRYPDTSATVIVASGAFGGPSRLRLSGPGIRTHRDIGDCGLPPAFWGAVATNHKRYPLGVDIYLAHGSQVMGLPRSTAVEEI